MPSTSKQNKQNAGKRNAAADDTDIVSKLAQQFTDRRNLAAAFLLLTIYHVICFAIWGIIISSRSGHVKPTLRHLIEAMDLDPKDEEWAHAAYLDFNRGASDEDYQKEYFENLNNPQLAKQQADAKQVPTTTTTTTTPTTKVVPSIKPKTSSDNAEKGTVQYYLDIFGVKQLMNGNDEDENAAMRINYAQMEEYLKEWISKYENRESFKEEW